MPEWLATTSAPPSVGMFSTPRTSTRNHLVASGRTISMRNVSMTSASRPYSSTTYSPVTRRRTKASICASFASASSPKTRWAAPVAAESSSGSEGPGSRRPSVRAGSVAGGRASAGRVRTGSSASRAAGSAGVDRGGGVSGASAATVSSRGVPATDGAKAGSIAGSRVGVGPVAGGSHRRRRVGSGVARGVRRRRVVGLTSGVVGVRGARYGARRRPGCGSWPRACPCPRRARVGPGCPAG